jgi:predicted Fe-S protein YdhL (DUF1289 family)
LAAHSDLTRDPTVAAAVVDLLLTGTTTHLPSKWKSKSVVQATISDQQLRRMHREKVDWAALEPDERRMFLENLNEPPKLELKAPGRSAARARTAAKVGPAKRRSTGGPRVAAGKTARRKLNGGAATEAAGRTRAARPAASRTNKRRPTASTARKPVATRANKGRPSSPPSRNRTRRSKSAR